ncbi:AAA-like domain-containing protein [Thiomicrospira microaerophila]|uniref:AAA-like domain-containing protein n=1 Tax=Thiomicrospira microaerophila TaxID=406020 RepID=UPI0005CA4D62|nr:AAA-like domain-containing protein [Thiomicrospira microaerophila]
MPKFFNTAGPTIKADHYHIDPLSRVDWEEIASLIAQKRYFILHAPRQTGKTSTLIGMMEALNAGDTYACVYANIEAAQAARGDVQRGVEAICSVIANSAARYLNDQTLKTWYYSKDAQATSYENKLTTLLELWAQTTRKPTVLLLDEVDALIGDTLISLLRQIRAGYAQRPEAFPHALILCGVRDIKDYRIHTQDHEIITGGSAFNIKAESIRMGNFTYQDCKALWLQHTQATGQTFDEKIWDKLWSDTQGQPWLVNALAHQLTWKNRELRDRSLHISYAHYMIAREELIQSRATHLDQLTDKLREERVYNVISSIIGNSEFEITKTLKPDDQLYVEDLGLIVSKPNVHISNDIYKEIIPRELTWLTQTNIPNQEQAWYLNEDNSLNTKKLLLAFQAFFRKNADSWIERFQYKEAGPQLLLQAFLQRIINGGGRIHREYALGRGRTDIFIEWPTTEQGFFGPMQHIVIETKILYANLEETTQKGIEQTKEYMSKVEASEGVLIIFDRSSTKSWDEKISHKEQDGLLVMGC